MGRGGVDDEIDLDVLVDVSVPERFAERAERVPEQYDLREVPHETLGQGLELASRRKQSHPLHHG
jgi:hypothetical protein